MNADRRKFFDTVIFVIRIVQSLQLNCQIYPTQLHINYWKHVLSEGFLITSLAATERSSIKKQQWRKHVRARIRSRALNTRAPSWAREHLRTFEKRAESWNHATIELCTHVSATTRHPVFWVWTRRDRAIYPPVWNNSMANARHFFRFHRTRGYRWAISRTGISANRRHSPRPYLRSHCSTNGAFANTEAFVYIYADIDVLKSCCYDERRPALRFCCQHAVRNLHHAIHARLHRTPTAGQSTDKIRSNVAKLKRV